MQVAWCRGARERCCTSPEARYGFCPSFNMACRSPDFSYGHKVAHTVQLYYRHNANRTPARGLAGFWTEKHACLRWGTHIPLLRTGCAHAVQVQANRPEARARELALQAAKRALWGWLLRRRERSSQPQAFGRYSRMLYYTAHLLYCSE